ncbi:MAG TPA: PucR family transcriptional regulator ligand-binding domain-containing protein [Egibacteraceae bacterium]|nr:PucR family transcriptional regulator ligand-binding domain-containing protein [Egibacteraceae bacterium]
MPLRLEDLLTDPALGLELVAGHAGLATRGPVRWAHISELPDPTPWLEGGEVLLTTGMGVKDSSELQRRLVAGLDERGCTGLGFGLGIWLDAVPDALREEADARALPLFTIPYEVPFIALTKRVSYETSAEHYATLRSAVDLHRRVLAAVISGKGVAGVAATIAEPVGDFTCVVFDYYGAPLVVTGPAGSAGGDLDLAQLWKVVAPANQERDRFEMPWGERVVAGSVVRVGEEIEAVLALVGDRLLHEHEALLMEQGLAGLSLELARGLSVREVHRSRVDDLLDEVATGRVSSQVLERRLARMGFDRAQGYRMLCLRSPEPVSQRALCALAEDIITASSPAGGQPIVGRWAGDVCCVAPSEDSELAARIAAAARSRGWSGVIVGRSRPRSDLTDMATALREAQIAAAGPGSERDGVRDVTDLGLSGLLASIGQDLSAQSFIARVLGPVLEHDARESSPLVDSLRAYLRHGCRPGPAAQELHVHRHTLAYRLDRIRDLCGRDPRDGENLLEFALALELLAPQAPAREQERT